jgi:hypothetical protein
VTLAKEQIEAIRDGQLAVTEVRQFALCDLALLAVALKPRPIEGAPKDGSWLLGWCGGDMGLCEARPFAWSKTKKQWCDLPDGDRFEGGWVPERFIELAALMEGK